MLWKSTPWPLLLIVAMTFLGCSAQNADPVRAAEVFLELVDSASEEQFRNLHSVILKRLCASDQAAFEDKTTQFSEKLAPSIRTELKLEASDIITGFSLPKSLDTGSGRILSSTPSSAQIEFTVGEEETEPKALALSMVFEENQWRACNIVTTKAQP